MFLYALQLDRSQFTKKNVLKRRTKVCDRLGFFSPFVIRPKLLLQENRWRSGIERNCCRHMVESQVRPILEYAAPVWCPFLVKDIVSVENVHRRASRLSLGQKRGEMDYEECCSILKWLPLKNRRLYFSLI